MRAVSGPAQPSGPPTAANILSAVLRRLVPVLACAALLAGCGGSATRVQTLAPYTGPPVPPTVPLSPAPALRAADRACAATVVRLRPLVTSTYTLDPESLSADELEAWSASYGAAAARWHALGRELARSSSHPVRALAGAYTNLAAGAKVLAKSVGELSTLGGNANVPGALAAVVTDIASVVGTARNHGLPDCVP